MSYTLPHDFFHALSEFIAEQILENQISSLTPENLSKRLEKYSKEFVKSDTCPFPIKVSRKSETLTENSGKLLVVIPTKGSIFVSQNDANHKGLEDIIKRVSKSVKSSARTLKKIHPTYGAGYSVSLTEADEINKFFRSFVGEVKSEVVRIELQARPENVYSTFMKNARDTHPTNTMVENLALWKVSKEKKDHDVKKAELAAAKKAESERKKAELAAAKKVSKGEATAPVVLAETQVFPEPDATLVVPPQKKTLLKRT
jgi:hypothetical protein